MFHEKRLFKNMIFLDYFIFHFPLSITHFQQLIYIRWILKVGTCDFEFWRFQMYVLYTMLKMNIKNGKDFWDTPYVHYVSWNIYILMTFQYKCEVSFLKLQIFFLKKRFVEDFLLQINDRSSRDYYSVFR